MKEVEDVVRIHSTTDACRLCHAKDVCLSSFLSDDDHKLFNQAIVHQALLNRGDRLYMAGDKLNSIFVLHSGSVKTYVESANGDSQITGFHLPGDLIGIHGIENKIHSDSVEALETSSVCELRFQNFEDLLAAFPTLQKPICFRVFHELSQEQDMLLVLGKMTAERRMAHFLLDISDRMAAHGRSRDSINLTMTRHDIGNYLGLAVETVSRLLSRFQTLGIVEVERRTIIIKDSKQLEVIFEKTVPDPARQTHA